MREETIRHLLKVWGKCVGERCLTATVAVMMKEEKITWTLLKVCVGKCVGERRGRMGGLAATAATMVREDKVTWHLLTMRGGGGLCDGLGQSQ